MSTAPEPPRLVFRDRGAALRKRPLPGRSVKARLVRGVQAQTGQEGGEALLEEAPRRAAYPRNPLFFIFLSQALVS